MPMYTSQLYGGDMKFSYFCSQHLHYLYINMRCHFINLGHEVCNLQCWEFHYVRLTINCSKRISEVEVRFTDSIQGQTGWKWQLAKHY